MRQVLMLALLGVSLTASMTSRAHADAASHRKAALQLLEAADMANALTAALDLSIKAQVHGNPALAPYESQMRAFFKKYVSWESLKEDFISLYIKAFTEREIKELLAFYQTPTGRKALKQLPVLMEQGSKIGMERVQSHLSELQQMMQSAPPPAAKPGK